MALGAVSFSVASSALFQRLEDTRQRLPGSKRFGLHTFPDEIHAEPVKTASFRPLMAIVGMALRRTLFFHRSQMAET